MCTIRIKRFVVVIEECAVGLVPVGVCVLDSTQLDMRNAQCTPQMYIGVRALSMEVYI